MGTTGSLLSMGFSTSSSFEQEVINAKQIINKPNRFICVLYLIDC
jgi:hypothetical protein